LWILNVPGAHRRIRRLQLINTEVLKPSESRGGGGPRLAADPWDLRPEGRWELDLDEARANLHGGLPYRVYAVLRPKSQAPPGTCMGWVSRNFEISTETIEINLR
jgi:hypothetical protein